MNITPPSVPFVELVRQYNDLQLEIKDALSSVMSKGEFVLGEEVMKFEAEFAEFNQSQHCIGVSDGTDAIQLALLALDIGPGDEVIVPTHTYIASVFAIQNAGAKPVLVDCHPKYYTIDVEQVERAVTRKTKALLPVHLYGHAVDMDPLLKIAERHHLFIVEDAAQAHGATYKGKMCGTIGDLGCFSFYPSKNLGAYGDGGAILTNKVKLAEKLYMLRNYGQKRKYVHSIRGFNSRLDSVQAAILRIKLRHLRQWNESRRKTAAYYNHYLKKCRVDIPMTADYANPVWHLYVVQSPDREGLQKQLDLARISWGIHYPIPVHLQEACKKLGYNKGDFPVSERLAGQILSLPIFPEIKEEEIERVVKAVSMNC